MFCGITVLWDTTARKNVVGNPVKGSLTLANMLAVRIRLHGLVMRQCMYIFFSDSESLWNIFQWKNSLNFCHSYVLFF